MSGWGGGAPPDDSPPQHQGQHLGTRGGGGRTVNNVQRTGYMVRVHDCSVAVRSTHEISREICGLSVLATCNARVGVRLTPRCPNGSVCIDIWIDPYLLLQVVLPPLLYPNREQPLRTPVPTQHPNKACYGYEKPYNYRHPKFTPPYLLLQVLLPPLLPATLVLPSPGCKSWACPSSPAVTAAAVAGNSMHTGSAVCTVVGEPAAPQHQTTLDTPRNNTQAAN
jgi:hypothetical protein